MKQDWHPDALDDLGAFTPLRWQHINPYSTFTLNMTQRLPLKAVF